MDCAAKGRGGRCVGPPIRQCARCEAVAYCSLSHQISHWNDHKEECERLEQQMKHAAELNDFPFTFCEEGMVQEKMCSFLSRRNLHCVGMWSYECSCRLSSLCYAHSRLTDCWKLSSVLCPCKDPVSPLTKQIESWEEYYLWRRLPLDSPVALLLHWPLTIYYATLFLSGRKMMETSREINIHYLGPDKELSQLAVFAELLALLPCRQVNLDFVGPAVPDYRDGEKINLGSYVSCDDEECNCNIASQNADSATTSIVTLRLHKGFYHDRLRDVIKDSFPHLIIAPNAGIAVYQSWLPTIELIKELNVPAVFSDFCEEAAHLAVRCISSVTGQPLRLPIQLNPFRQPLVVEDSTLRLPCFSNCFLFGI